MATPPAPPDDQDTSQSSIFSDEEIKKATENIKKFTDALGEAAKSFANIRTAADSFGSIVGKLETAGVDTLLKELRAGTTAFKSAELNKTTQQISENIQDIAGMNALAISRAEFGIDNLSKKMFDSSVAISKQYAATKQQLLDGSTLTAAALFGDYDNLVSSFKESVLNDTRLFSAGVKGMTLDVLKDTALAKESLRMTPSEINEIFQRELSETGKISGEMLQTYEKTVLAVAEATGDVPIKVSQDLSRMLGDFTHFGNLTIPQMGELSATIHKLGIDINDVTRLSDQFSSFDKAAQTMSNLAASTGATLDTLELFRLANTDQEQFIISLRSQLEDQGVEFENMNILQKKQIASAFGIDPIVLQRLLNDNFDNIESAKGRIDEISRGMTDEEMDKRLVDMGNLVKNAEKLTSTDIANLIASLSNASAGYAKTIEQSFRSTVYVTADAVTAMDGAREAALRQLSEVQKSLDGINSAVISGRVTVPAPPPRAQTPATSTPPPPAPAATPPAPTASAATAAVPAPAAPTASDAATPAAAPAAASTVIATTTASLTAANQAGRAGSYEAAGTTAVSPTASPPPAAAPPTASATPPPTAPAPATPPPTPPAAPQKVEITLKLIGGDEVGRAIASSVIQAGIEGVAVGGTTAATVKLVTDPPAR